jgi:hypothetical protein
MFLKKLAKHEIFTIMQPMPIVANLALSSVSPELMNSEVE